MKVLSRADIIRWCIILIGAISIALISQSCSPEKEKVAAQVEPTTVQRMFKVDISRGSNDTTIYVIARDKYDAERAVDKAYLAFEDTIVTYKHFEVVMPIRAK